MPGAYETIPITLRYERQKARVEQARALLPHGPSVSLQTAVAVLMSDVTPTDATSVEEWCYAQGVELYSEIFEKCSVDTSSPLVIRFFDALIDDLRDLMTEDYDPYDNDVGELPLLVYFLSERHRYYVDLEWNYNEPIMMMKLTKALLSAIHSLSHSSEDISPTVMLKFVNFLACILQAFPPHRVVPSIGAVFSPDECRKLLAALEVNIIRTRGSSIAKHARRETVRILCAIIALPSGGVQLMSELPPFRAFWSVMRHLAPDRRCGCLLCDTPRRLMRLVRECEGLGLSVSAAAGRYILKNLRDAGIVMLLMDICEDELGKEAATGGASQMSHSSSEEEREVSMSPLPEDGQAIFTQPTSLHRPSLPAVDETAALVSIDVPKTLPPRRDETEKVTPMSFKPLVTLRLWIERWNRMHETHVAEELLSLDSMIMRVSWIISAIAVSSSKDRPLIDDGLDRLLLCCIRYLDVQSLEQHFSWTLGFSVGSRTAIETLTILSIDGLVNSKLTISIASWAKGLLSEVARRLHIEGVGHGDIKNAAHLPLTLSTLSASVQAACRSDNLSCRRWLFADSTDSGVDEKQFMEMVEFLADAHCHLRSSLLDSKLTSTSLLFCLGVATEVADAFRCPTLRLRFLKPPSPLCGSLGIVAREIDSNCSLTKDLKLMITKRAETASALAVPMPTAMLGMTIRELPV